MYETAALILFGAYAGVALLLLSLVLYVARTGSRRPFRRLWCERSELTRLESAINRLGLVLASVGVLGSLALHWRT